jgi:hypothetical protein
LRFNLNISSLLAIAFIAFIAFPCFVVFVSNFLLLPVSILLGIIFVALLICGLLVGVPLLWLLLAPFNDRFDLLFVEFSGCQKGLCNLSHDAGDTSLLAAAA